MKTTTLLLGCFALTAAVQLAVPAWMIVGHERTLHAGAVFKFRTQPVDPYDAFRGRYVWLRLEQDSLPIPPDTRWQNGQQVFAVMDTGADGFARFRELRSVKPSSEPYLTVRISRIDGQTAYLQMPFDRFYMEESVAPAAERAYREYSRTAERTAYITARIQDGAGVIENLWIDGTPIREFLTRK